MTFNYSTARATATRLINNFGDDVTLHIRTAGVFNPVDGSGAGDTETDTVVKAVRLNFNNNDIDGTLVKTGDFMLLIDGILALTTDDKVTVDTVKYAIVRQMPLKPGDTRLLTKAHCRR